jgi:GLPGLI family protein
MVNESKPIDFKVIANSSSLYSYKKRKVKPDNILQNLNNLLYLDSEEYFVDFLNDEYVFKKNISSKTYYVNFAPSECNFVNNKTEVINGYRCNLAENKNNNIKVWYTKDIPLNAGPKKYLGLPGLVVKVELSEVNFITLKSIERTTDIIKEVPDDIQIIEFEDYNSEIGKMSNNIFEN